MTHSALKNNWQINKAGHLYKRYAFKDFMGALDFANKIAPIAEAQAHHPDLTISWGACTVEIWTHSENRLTQKDFDLADLIDEIS